MAYAMTQNNLGNAFSTLAEVEDKAANCKLAIAAYAEALKIFTPEKFPYQNRFVQFNMEIVKRFLSE